MHETHERSLYKYAMMMCTSISDIVRIQPLGPASTIARLG